VPALHVAMNDAMTPRGCTHILDRGERRARLSFKIVADNLDTAIDRYPTRAECDHGTQDDNETYGRTRVTLFETSKPQVTLLWGWWQED